MTCGLLLSDVTTSNISAMHTRCCYVHVKSQKKGCLNTIHASSLLRRGRRKNKTCISNYFTVNNSVTDTKSSRKIHSNESSSSAILDCRLQSRTQYHVRYTIRHPIRLLSRGPGGLSRECVLRIPMRVVKGD